MKAIHNGAWENLLSSLLSFKEQKYDNESNSQPASSDRRSVVGCLSKSKSTIMKAIHNYADVTDTFRELSFKEQKYDNESNSQQES